LDLIPICQVKPDIPGNQGGNKGLIALLEVSKELLMHALVLRVFYNSPHQSDVDSVWIGLGLIYLKF